MEYFYLKKMCTFSSARLLAPAESHVCIFRKRPDPSKGGLFRWSLPYNEICLCQGVVAPKVKPSNKCATTDDQHCTDDSSCKLWFVDDSDVGPLTRRHNWNKGALDDLLQRTDYCGMF